MTPPLSVKIASGTQSFVFACLGLRNIFAPGKGIFFLPNDDKFQLHCFGAPPGELSRGQIAYTSIFGHVLLGYAACKIMAVFSGKEGTFLRRNIFAVLGISQVLMASTLLIRFESDFKAAGASLKGLAFLIGGEGLLLVYDAFFRPRPLKRFPKSL